VSSTWGSQSIGSRMAAVFGLLTALVVAAVALGVVTAQVQRTYADRIADAHRVLRRIQFGQHGRRQLCRWLNNARHRRQCL